MTEEWLRKWVKNTIFIDSETKKKLLAMSSWDEDIFSVIKSMFEKYAQKEIDLLNYMLVASNQAYIETLQNIEKKQKEEEIDELILLEKQLEEVW